jgi:hypothetical protein
VEDMLAKRDRERMIREGRIPSAFLPDAEEGAVSLAGRLKFASLAYDDDANADMEEVEDMVSLFLFTLFRLLKL